MHTPVHPHRTYTSNPARLAFPQNGSKSHTLTLMLSTTTTGKRPLATVFEKAPRTLFAYLGGEVERRQNE